MRRIDDYTLRKLQNAILCNLKDAHMNENYIIELLNRWEDEAKQIQ